MSEQTPKKMAITEPTVLCMVMPDDFVKMYDGLAAMSREERAKAFGRYLTFEGFDFTVKYVPSQTQRWKIDVTLTFFAVTESEPSPA